MSFLQRFISTTPLCSRMQIMHITRFSSTGREITSLRRKRDSATASSSPSQDILLGTLKMAATTENILELIGSHITVMNNKHLIQALRSIFTLHKNGNSKLSTAQILKHPEFDRLCSSLKRRAGAIELNETIEALKVVGYMGVQADSTIVQVLLQLIRHQINQLSLQQIIFLDFLLQQMKKTPLTEAIQVALPIIFDAHLSTKLDKSNLSQITDCLQYTSKRDVSESSVEFLVDVLSKYKGQVDHRAAMSVIWSICDFDSDDFFEPLLRNMLHTMMVYADNFNFNDLETTLTKLGVRYGLRYPFYYNEVFSDLCANHLIEHDLGFEQAVYLMRRFMKTNHQSNDLLDYACGKVHKNSVALEGADIFVFTSLIFALAQTEYKPEHWDEVKDLIIKSTIFTVRYRKDIIWLKLAASLCTLGIYKPDVLDKALDASFLHAVIKKGFLSDYENFILLVQAINLIRPEFTSLLPPEPLIEKIKWLTKEVSEFPMEGALQRAYGGSSYVLTKVTTLQHHLIDHVIVFRKGGLPVPFVTKDTPQLLEGIDCGPESQIVAVLCLNKLHYTANTKQMKGTTALMIKTLEAKGCSVVPFSLEDWVALEDFERIPYLTQQIKLRVNDVDRIEESI